MRTSTILSRSLVFGFVFITCIHVQATISRAADKEPHLLSLEIIRADQEQAKRILIQYDKNDNQSLDATEIRQLPWANEASKFDVNKDGILMSLEISLWFANRRNEGEVLGVDQTAAQRFMTRYDQNDDHELDENEMREGKWPPDPAEFDKDQDGRLTVFEIATRFAQNRRQRKELGVEGSDQSYAISTMNIYDKNGDRRIDAEELSNFAGNDGGTISLDVKGFDANQDGTLSIAELAAGFSQKRSSRGVTPADQNEAQRLLAKYDRNRDGKLDANEMQQARWPEDRTQFDANADGSLTLTEIEDGLAKIKKTRGITDDDNKGATQLIIRYDKNRNSRIDMDEIGNRSETGNSVGLQLTILTFVEFDDDHDQQLSRNEVAQFIARRREKKQ